MICYDDATGVRTELTAVALGRWFGPDQPSAAGVRIDRGNPNSPLPSQQVDHAIMRRDGEVIGRDGRPISGSIKDR